MTNLVIMDKTKLNYAIQALQDGQKVGIHDPCIDEALIALQLSTVDFDLVFGKLLSVLAGETTLGDIKRRMEMREREQKYIDDQHHMIAMEEYRQNECRICLKRHDECNRTDDEVMKCIRGKSTCTNCRDVEDCRLAFDPLNVDGKCLRMRGMVH